MKSVRRGRSHADGGAVSDSVKEAWLQCKVTLTTAAVPACVWSMLCDQQRPSKHLSSRLEVAVIAARIATWLAAPRTAAAWLVINYERALAIGVACCVRNAELCVREAVPDHKT